MMVFFRARQGKILIWQNFIKRESPTLNFKLHLPTICKKNCRVIKCLVPLKSFLNQDRRNVILIVFLSIATLTIAAI